MENGLSMKLNSIIKEMQDGLVPEVLANWYYVIQCKARELCPDAELREKMIVEQNPILPMKFTLSISKRTVPFLISAIDLSLPDMPYSTRLYFEKVQSIILDEFNNTKVGSL